MNPIILGITGWLALGVVCGLAVLILTGFDELGRRAEARRLVAETERFLTDGSN